MCDAVKVDFGQSALVWSLGLMFGLAKVVESGFGTGRGFGSGEGDNPAAVSPPAPVGRGTFRTGNARISNGADC